MRVAYDAQAFLSPNGGTGKGAQLRTLIGPYFDQFTGFASTDWLLAPDLLDWVLIIVACIGLNHAASRAQLKGAIGAGGGSRLLTTSALRS